MSVTELNRGVEGGEASRGCHLTSSPNKTMASTSKESEALEPCTRLVVELSGGLELLFGKKKRLEVELPDTFRAGTDGDARGKEAAAAPPTVRDVIAYVAKTECTERVELFTRNGSVTPGILVLLNGADWELEGELDAEVFDGDEISFISTLHGG